MDDGECKWEGSKPPKPPKPPILPQPVPDNPEEPSEPSALDTFFSFMENFVFVINDLVEGSDVYNFTGSKWYRFGRYSLPLGVVEGVVAGLRQINRDSWYESLTPLQRVFRPTLVFAETLATDWLSQKVATKMAGAGLAVGGPPGAAAAYMGASTATTKAMDRFWMQEFNPWAFNFLGAWP